MSQPISGFLFDREMQEAGFTRHEMSNQRLRDAAYRLLVRGRLYRFNDADEIEYGVSGPFNDDERRSIAQPVEQTAESGDAEFHEAAVKLVCDMLNAWMQGVPYIKVNSGLQCRVNALLTTPKPAAPPTQTVQSETTAIEACRAIVKWCDENPPAGEALWCIQLARQAIVAQPVEQTRALTDEQIEDLQEAREILENMVRSVELDGNYSTEATCTFLRQALQCLTAARPASGETE